MIEIQQRDEQWNVSEWCRTLLMIHNGNQIGYLCDHYDSLAWNIENVKDMLLAAYEAGLKDGREENGK